LHERQRGDQRDGTERASLLRRGQGV
jgi:hypothetical protein